MHIKTTMRYHHKHENGAQDTHMRAHTHTHTHTILFTIPVLERMRNKELSFLANGCKRLKQLRNNLAVPFKVSIFVLYSLAIPVLGFPQVN